MFTYSMIDVDLNSLLEEISIAKTKAFNTYEASRKNDQLTERLLEELNSQLYKISSMQEEIKIKIKHLKNS